MNIAADLEAATKGYGIPLLISGTLMDCCSNYAWRHCRQIDNVVLAGSVIQLKLYTFELDIMAVKPGPTDYNRAIIRLEKFATDRITNMTEDEMTGKGQRRMSSSTGGRRRSFHDDIEINEERIKETMDEIIAEDESEHNTRKKMNKKELEMDEAL